MTIYKRSQICRHPWLTESNGQNTLLSISIPNFYRKHQIQVPYSSQIDLCNFVLVLYLPLFIPIQTVFSTPLSHISRTPIQSNSLLFSIFHFSPLIFLCWKNKFFLPSFPLRILWILPRFSFSLYFPLHVLIKELSKQFCLKVWQ